MQTMKLELTLAEVNQLLDALGGKSYVEVYQLIPKIQQQAEVQIQEGEKTLQPHEPQKKRNLENE